MDGKSVLFVAVIVFFTTTFSNATVLSLEDIVYTRDQARLRKLFAGPIEDLPTAYHVANGLSVLGFQPSDSNIKVRLCQLVQKVDKADTASLFYATSIFKQLGSSCKADFKNVDSVLKAALKEKASTETLYHAVLSLANLELPVDSDTILHLVNNAVEEEDTSLSLGRAFHIGSVLADTDKLLELFERIEEAVARADETSNTLYFESLEATSTIINGIFALAEAVGKKPLVEKEQVIKLGNFIASSKYATTIADAYHILSAALTLTMNKFVVPTAVLPLKTLPISSTNPNFIVRLTNILDGKIDNADVMIKKIENPDGHLETKKLTMTETDSATYSYPLHSDVSRPGEYVISLSTSIKNQSEVVNLPNVNIVVMVSYEVMIGDAKLLVADKDQGVTTKSFPIQFPNKAPEVLDVDVHSKLEFTFSLKNKDKSSVAVHQAFVKFSLQGQEIFYIAEHDSSYMYKFELDVSQAGKDFNHKSGVYDMSLIIGDFAVVNPLFGKVGDINLKFSGVSSEVTDKYVVYNPKSVIEHMFKAAEKRPPTAVSNSFTILVFLPLGLLFVLWFFLGVNISNIGKTGVWGILFHLGLSGIFLLYYFFWIKLNMFQTLQYLVIVGGLTFLSGNRMLKKVAESGMIY